MICKFEGCDKNVIAKGYCMTHYRRILRNGTLELKNICGTTKCINCGSENSKTWRRGYCDKCYFKRNINENIFLKKSDWENKTDKELEKYINDILKHYRKYGYPYHKFTLDEKIEEFNKFKNYDSKSLLKDKEIHQTMHLLGVAWSYFPHHLEISCDNRPAPIEYFNEDNLFRNVIRKRLKTGTYITDGGIRKAFKILGGSKSVSNFRPSAARCIYDNYLNGEVVYDFSSGFGGRLFGALASNKVTTYIGTDPSIKTYNGLVEIKNDFSYLNKTVEIYNKGSEDLVLPNNSIELCFSSPPYFYLEKYSLESTQSYIKYSNYQDWLNGFVRETVNNCYKALKGSGLFLINIASISKYKTLNVDYIDICKKIGFKLLDINYLILSTPIGNRKNGNYKKEPIYILVK